MARRTAIIKRNSEVKRSLEGRRGQGVGVECVELRGHCTLKSFGSIAVVFRRPSEALPLLSAPDLQAVSLLQILCKFLIDTLRNQPEIACRYFKYAGILWNLTWWPRGALNRFRKM